MTIGRDPSGAFYVIDAMTGAILSGPYYNRASAEHAMRKLQN